MHLQLNEETYLVDSEPLREKTRDAIRDLINSKEEEHPIIKAGVKEVCRLAIKHLGLTKERNDDPIVVISDYLVQAIFTTLEEKGVTLTGTKQDQPTA